MARRKTGDKKITDKKNRAASGEENIHHVQADNYSIAFDELHVDGDVGDIRIGHTIGYTAEQVSVLLKQITTTLQPKPFDGRCPYKGLDVFEEEDAELFFGRERLVTELVGRVKESRTVFITGPSGSGKSSLVRAGLIHALKQGKIKSSDRWLYETMKPGREPIKDLALAFSRLKSPELEDYFRAHSHETDILNKCAESVLSGRKDHRFVLFIDQFEEVFTQINSEEERVAFINMLAHAGTVENGRVIVLFAMRSDFVSNCATYPLLNEMLSQEFRQIGAMQPEELVSAIALPARHVGLPIEDELIARIINDMKGEPGALPLMQFALKDLFDSQQEKGGIVALTLSDYLKHGGIQQSLERHADATFAELNQNEQELARSIFSGLIEIGRGTQDTKRTALFDELVPANTQPEDVQTIIGKLADARLIITDEQAGKDTVTISHEKLIEAWPWLKKLVNENRDAIALQNEIASDAKEWDDHNHDESYLYTGARLANAREQLEAKKFALSMLAHSFIEVGVKAHADELEATKQRALQLRRRSVYLTAALVVALIAVGGAVFFGIQSRQQTKIAQIGELAAQSVSQRDYQFDLSLLLSVEAFLAEDTTRTRNALLANTLTNPQLGRYLQGHRDPVKSVAFSSDGKTLGSGSDDGTIILWDTESQQPIGQPLNGHRDAVESVIFSPDGKTLASGNYDGTIILWDVESHQPIGEPLNGHSDAVESVVFSPDGKTLASGSYDGTIIVWDVESQQPIGQPLSGHSDTVDSVAFGPDGKTLASGSLDTTIILWDVESQLPIGRPLNGHSDAIYSVVFSPDGKTLASGSRDTTIVLWDVERQQPISQPLAGHNGSVNSVVFSPDGKTLASGSWDTNIILWDVESREPIRQPLAGHNGSIYSVVFSPDGKTLASGSWDTNIILWDVEVHPPSGQLLHGSSDAVMSVAFSPDGKTLASGSYDSSIVLWDIENQRPIRQPLKGHSKFVESVVFSPDGKTLASGSADGTIILWDVESHEPIGQPLKEHSDLVYSVAFSPDGKILASGSWDMTIILWDVASHQSIGQPLSGHTDDLLGIAFSPDGKTLASGSWDTTVILWDVASRQPIGQPLKKHRNGVSSVAFSPDGKTLGSGGVDGAIILWDMESHPPIGQPLKGHSEFVESVAFSPNGKTFASGSDDFTIILWDVESHEPIGQLLNGHSASVNSVAFHPDSKTLASGSGDNTIILWDLDPQSWIEKSCQRAGRNFTHAEWAQYFPNEEYRKTCDQWPLEPEVTSTPSPTP